MKNALEDTEKLMTVDDIKHEFILAIVDTYKKYRKNKDAYGNDDNLTIIYMSEFVSLSNLFIKFFTKEEYKSLMKEHFPGENHEYIAKSIRN